MLHMGELTDYGIVLMSYLATEIALINTLRNSVNSLSNAIKMPLSTVRKVLKILSNSNLLKPARWAQGGYNPNCNPTKLSVDNITTSVDGPALLIKCNSSGSHYEQKFHYLIKSNFAHINNAVLLAIDEVKLSDIILPQINVKATNFNKILSICEADEIINSTGW